MLRRHRWLPFLLVVAGLAAFVNALDNPFVFDDRDSIVENPNIRQLWPLTAALSAPLGSPVRGRPATSLSFAISYAMGGLSPWAYHAFNLAVHLLAGLVLFGILRCAFTTSLLAGQFAGRADLLAFTCALFWLVHPLQTEVINYVTQRTEALMGLFYLLTLYAAIRGITAQEARWYVTAVAACAVGMLCKESMVTAPLMVLLYDTVFHAGSVRRALRERSGLYGGLAATSLIVVFFVATRARASSVGMSAGVSPWTYLLNQAVIIPAYLKRAVWPRNLIFDYGLPRPLSLGEVWPYAALVLILLVGTAIAWRRRRDVAFLGIWFFVTLAPSSSIVPIVTEVGAERRMYLPLIAVVVVIVCSTLVFSRRVAKLDGVQAFRLRARWKSFALQRPAHGTDLKIGTTSRDTPVALSERWTPMALPVFAVYLVLAVLTLQRNAEYQSPARIWQTVLDRRPTGRAYYNRGLELKELGKRDEALRYYQRALPDFPDAHYAVGFELESDGKYAEAIEHYREYVRLRAEDIHVDRGFVRLGIALKAVGKLDDAADAFRGALRLQPRHADARGALADVLLQQKKFDAAVTEYREYLRLNPQNADAYYNLGVALVSMDREQEAAEAFRQAVTFNPNDPAMRQNLGNALAATGDLDGAISQFEEALKLAPGNASLHHALAAVLAARGRTEEAVAHFKRAIEIDPKSVYPDR